MYLQQKQIIKSIIDLYWEYDRMSTSGQESLEKLAKIFNVPTEDELKNGGKHDRQS